MKWLLVFGLIAILLNAPETLAGSDEDSGSSSDSDDSFDSSDWSDSSRPPKSPPHPGKKKSPCPMKIEKSRPVSLSPEYFGSSCSTTVKKVNSTYNAVKMNLVVHKNLPTHTKVVVKIYQSSSIDGSYTSIGETCSFGLSDTTSQYHKYLPVELRKAVISSGTLLKGSYSYEDYGYFKFYKLLSKQQLKHSHYKIIFNYECDGKPIFSLDQRFKKHKSK